jgi:hypothetical protein
MGTQTEMAVTGVGILPEPSLLRLATLLKPLKDEKSPATDKKRNTRRRLNVTFRDPQITQENTIFVTSKLFSVSDIIFYTEFKYVLRFSISRKVFKGHTVII